jgi:hypothetical protein
MLGAEQLTAVKQLYKSNTLQLYICIVFIGKRPLLAKKTKIIGQYRGMH